MSLVFNQFLDIFDNQILSERILSDTTRDFYRLRLTHIRSHLGEKPIDELRIADVSEFLRKYPPRASNQYRTFLGDIFKHAIGMGYTEANPAVSTIPRVHHKKRQRMTLDGYRAIYSCAPQWLQNAMDLGIQTLQRRNDICNMMFKDIEQCALKVIQEKTKKHGASAYLEIEILPPLQAVIERCRDDILSPYLVHRLPNKLMRQNLRLTNRAHVTQVLPDYLSKEFNKAREKSGFYSHLTVNERPTFHEIRSLGSAIYKQMGVNPQELLGHKGRDDSAMTEHYISGHVVWTKVSAGINLDDFREQVNHI